MGLPRNIAKILNRLKSRLLQNKSLLFATIISLLLHIFLLTKFALTLPELNEDQQALEMRLVNLPPMQESAPAPIKESVPKLKPTPLVTPEQPTKQNPVLEDKASISPIDEAPSTIEKPAIESPPEDAQETKQTLEPTTTEPSSTETIESADTPEINGSTNQFALSPYKYVETVFEVRRGSDASAAGTTRIIFNLDNKNGTYSLSSNTEAKGLTSLFFDALIQKSEGSVTLNGLIPNLFTYQYGTNQSQKAHFKWEEATLELSSAKGDKTENLVAGTQDILSFMYQFMFTPPLDDTQISITNGKNLRTYSYHFEGEKVITTKLGSLNTLHLLKSGSEKEKTELWLAIDYQYLPVQIRKTEKDGSVIEQTATEIYTLPYQ